MNPREYDSALATVLRRKRGETGLSQAEAGRLVGVTFQQLQKYEKGHNRVCFSRLVQLAEAYGTTPEQFIADVREVLNAKTPDADHGDSRQTRELIRLANAVPHHALDRVLKLLRALAKPSPEEGRR